MKQVPWWSTALGPEEEAQLIDAIHNHHISQGQVTEEFEREVAGALGVPYVLATTSCSVALLMAMMALGVGPGDEVIVPDRTFIASAHGAVLLGARVVLADTLPDVPLLDVAQLEDKISPRTKAIVAVHLNGRAVDMEALQQLAAKHHLALVEDAAQAMFSRGPLGYLGTLSDVGCFSLGMTKLITTGQGGLLATSREDIYERLRLIRNHGVEDTFDATFSLPGLNFKFTDMQAAIGLAQLRRVEARVQHVRAIYEAYAAELARLPFLKLVEVKVAQGEVPLWVEALCPERDRLMKFLAAEGIQTRKFLPSLHLSPHLANAGDFPRSDLFHEQGVFLPCGPEQPQENVCHVLQALHRYADRAAMVAVS